jgi:hypothetical protein
MYEFYQVAQEKQTEDHGLGCSGHYDHICRRFFTQAAFVW